MPNCDRLLCALIAIQFFAPRVLPAQGNNAKQSKEAKALYLNAGHALKKDDLKAAFEGYTEALRLYRSARDRKGEARALYGLGSYYFFSKEKAKSLEAYTQALEIFRAEKDRRE